MKTSSSISVAVFFGVMTFFSQAYAQDQSGFREAMDSCASELGISRPERGSRPSDEDREKIKSCLESKGFTKSQGGGRGGPGGRANREAFEACMKETGVTRPSDEDRAKMDACLKSKQ